MALGAGVLGFSGFYIGVKQIGAPRAMLYQYAVAPLATLFSWLVLKEQLAWLQLLGMAVVVLGVSMGVRAGNRSDAKARLAVETATE
jgi:drug/metabolite transporter (DMT)-like permease